MRRLLVLAFLVVGCGAPAASTPTPDPVVVLATATAGPTATATPTATPTAQPTPDPVDAVVAFEVFKATLGDFTEFLQTDLAEAIEADYYWVASVDRTTYDPEKHMIRWDVTADYESVYQSKPAEWRADTWELYRDFSRDIWGSFIEGVGEPEGVTPDWPTWTPRLRLVANGGTLSVDCPGSLVYAISIRDATQAEYADECKFKT